MRSKEQYLSSLSDGREVYYRGKRVHNVADHQVLRISALHSAKLYDMKDRIVKDGGEEISAYLKVPRGSGDLLQRHKVIYDHTTACNGIFNISQAIGSDAIFALMVVSAKVDRETGSSYHERVRRFWEYVAKNDLTMATAQTDVKGDRAKRPSQQSDLDMYVRIVERRQDGIVVRGAKAHTTQAAVADEILVIPTRAMTQEDKDFAVAFSVPASTKGLKMIVRPIDEVEGNSSSLLSKVDHEHETLTIFDDVFVPWDRVFMAGEYKYAGALANLFATFHRFTAVSYRASMANLFLGAASLVAKANGIQDARHVKEDLLTILSYKEFLRMSAISAANEPLIDEGVAIPNPLYTNLGKLYTNTHFHEVVKCLIDVAGGIISTMPSEEDLRNPEEMDMIFKYLRGAEPGQRRVQLLKLVKELASSSLTGYWLTMMLHAEGSVEASKIALLREYDLREAEEMVEKILDQSKG